MGSNTCILRGNVHTGPRQEQGPIIYCCASSVPVSHAG